LPRGSLFAPSNKVEEINFLYTKKILKRSEDVENMLADESYLLFDFERTYNLFDYKEMEVWEDVTNHFPYLKPIILTLINMRLEKPYLSVKEAINLILDEIKEQELSKVKKIGKML
jgi:hypothetical protein